MDIDDTIQQLLNTTGWSCDDLLEKLQRYKAQKDQKNQEETQNKTPSTTATNEDLPKENSEENNKKLDKSLPDGNSSASEKEKVEKNEANDNIIDKVINKSVQDAEKINNTAQNGNEEQEEITEVRVIALDDDEEEDDYFEEESSYASTGHSNKIEYLETFPRKTLHEMEPISLIDSDEKSDSSSETKDNNKQEVSNNSNKTSPKENQEVVSFLNVMNLDFCSKEKIGNAETEQKQTTTEKECKKEETIEKCFENKTDKNGTTMIYKENCEKILNSNSKINDSADLEETINTIKNEHLYHSTPKDTNNEDDQENHEEEHAVLTNVEDIRNNLKEQLNCLRTRKKEHFLQPLRPKLVNPVEFNKKTLNIANIDSKSSQETNTECSSETTDCFKKPSEANNEDKQGQDLYSQTNEFGLVILSVEGGIDLPEQNEKNTESSKQDLDLANDSSNTFSSALDNSVDSNSLFPKNKENEEEPNETSGVLEEIRKIIRKQKQSSSTSDKNKTVEVSKVNSFNFFSRSVDSSKTVDNNDKSDCINISTENSQSSFTNDETSQNVDKNSPFVSNTLDEFLTGNSKLNISYKVPKCGAEEGLTENYRAKSPLLVKKIVEIDKEDTPIVKKTEKFKAKTVAQKRKLLERHRMKELRQQAKILKQQPENKLTVINTNKVQNKCSYIEINNEKLWVKGTKPNVCVARINSTPPEHLPQNQPSQKRKLSLLTELTKKHSEKIKYRPGPLSKKCNLQLNGLENWKTEMKSLPKITLEVTPKIGQCFPPCVIERLPKNNGIITTDLVEFALSVLKTKNNTTNQEKTFKFPVNYTNNQEQIIVKKQKVIPIKFNVPQKNDKEQSVESVVENVLDDLIRYVEIKEIAPTLIKEDDSEYSRNDKECDKMPVIAENISSIFKKPQKKRSKVELELMRLSCKVVNVEVEENSSEEACDKPYCRLGCVCKSLKCDGMISYHCQNVGCMLGCKCPREKSIEYDKLMLPAGTDILSKDTVTRIEDEAKKDLAKIEREFTQMVIHTNDKTIVVGTGGRHKTRRSTKAPVKYSDYIDSNFERVESDKTKSPKKNDFFKNCYVKLEKLNLQDIVPYCMFHNEYNCYCGGNSLTPTKQAPKKPVVKNIFPKHTVEETTEKHLEHDKKYPKRIAPVLKIQKELSNNSDISENNTEIKTLSRRPIRVKRKIRGDFSYTYNFHFHLTSCSRAMEVPFNAKKYRKLSAKSLVTLTEGDFINNITQSEVLKAKILEITPDTPEADILKQQLISEWESFNKSNSLLAEIANNETKHKRKQILEVRNDDKPSFNQDLAIQRRKRHLARKAPVIEPVFEGEIIVDERYMELLQKMGAKTVMEGYARLLPWPALINSFKKNNVKIWCMIDQPSRLLINKGNKTPPKNYIDIRQSNHTTDVIGWILTGKLPSKYPEEHVSFILKQTKDNYEICGLCTKNLNEESLQNNVSTERQPSPDNITDKRGVVFTHKDLNGEQQELYLSRGRFQLQELMEENLAFFGENSIKKNKLYMWVALPEIYKTCKWRMVFLNSDFSFLYFSKAKYSIKYTDLRNVSNTAKSSGCTIILKNSIICCHYDHSEFGIYFDPHYQNRLFIGPYFRQYKENDIETLRYINQSLVCTESFNQMQGKTDYKCGHWLVERPYNRSTVRPTIDLTVDTCKTGVKRKMTPDFPQIVQRSRETEKVIVTENNELVKVMDSEPRKPEEFNRYIITNIPHLGYLGAFQHEMSTEIDVSWPFENKMLRFPNVKSATTFLQCRFSSLLQPVPETFKISIIVLTQIDLETTKPIDASILSGHYVCGEFGCYNIKTITNEFCTSKIGVDRDELMRIFARRAQMFVRQKIEELADTVNIPKVEGGRQDIVNILDKARSEIEELKKADAQYTLKKNWFLLKKRELALKAFRLISFLPENEKQLESWKFRQILRRRSILLPKTVLEPIEIPDSDEEEQNNSKQNESDKKSTSQDLNPASSKTLGFDSKSTVPLDKQSGASNTFLVDLSIPKVRPPVITYPPQRKLKSILKTNIVSPPTPSTSEAPPLLTKESTSVATNAVQNEEASTDAKQPYLAGIKLVRTNKGKLVLVSDDEQDTDKPFKIHSAGGKQLLIKDNKILSVKSIKPQTSTTQNIVLSPTKKIILKKNASQPTPKSDKTGTEIPNKIGENTAVKKPRLIVTNIKNRRKILIGKNLAMKTSQTQKATEKVDEDECITIIEDSDTETNSEEGSKFSEKFNTESPIKILRPSHTSTDTKKTVVNIDKPIVLKEDTNTRTEEVNKNTSDKTSEKCLDKKTTNTENNLEKSQLIHSDIEGKPPDIKINEENSTEIKQSVSNNDIIIKQSEPKTINEVEHNTDESNLTKTDDVLPGGSKDVEDNKASELEKLDTATNICDLIEKNEGKNFLVIAVSEIFPSKGEASVQDSLTNAAALTQKNAASENLEGNDFNNNFNRCDLIEQNRLARENESLLTSSVLNKLNTDSACETVLGNTELGMEKKLAEKKNDSAELNLLQHNDVNIFQRIFKAMDIPTLIKDCKSNSNREDINFSVSVTISTETSQNKKETIAEINCEESDENKNQSNLSIKPSHRNFKNLF